MTVFSKKCRKVNQKQWFSDTRTRGYRKISMTMRKLTFDPSGIFEQHSPMKPYQL